MLKKLKMKNTTSKLSSNTQPEKQFIIVNELAEVFYGLKGGLPQFTNEWDKAKPLNNESQFKSVERGTFYKLEMMYL